MYCEINQSINHFYKCFVIIFLARNETFGNRVLHCLSQVPCASLVAWIILLVGLGGLTGGLLIGIQKTRDLVESDNL